MRTNPLRIMTLGLAGLVATGLIAFQQGSASAASDKPAFKRNDDSPDIVLVDDDGDGDDRGLARHGDDDTGTNGATSGQTQTQGQTRTQDQTGTGALTGRDHSRDQQARDWTRDGSGQRHRDWTANHTNDRSRHNTRG